MDYKSALHSCIDRIPDDNTQALKRLHDMAKKEVSRTRCAPTAKPDKRKLANELKDLLIDIAVCQRTDR